MPTRIEILPEGFAETIAAYDGILNRFLVDAERSARAVGERAVELIQRYYRGAGETTPDRTAVRSGRLRASYTTKTARDTESVQMRLGNIKPGTSGEVLAYAAIHEFGGVIRPKRAQFLAIPLPDALTPTGVARGKPRDFPNTFIARAANRASHHNEAIIFQKLDDGRARPLFKLVRQVTIKARPALRPVRPLVIQELQRRVVEDFRTAMGAEG